MEEWVLLIKIYLYRDVCAAYEPPSHLDDWSTFHIRCSDTAYSTNTINHTYYLLTYLSTTLWSMYIAFLILPIPFQNHHGHFFKKATFVHYSDSLGNFVYSFSWDFPQKSLCIAGFLSDTLKMEFVSKNTIFGLKMMVKSGLQKFILKSLHAGR